MTTPDRTSPAIADLGRALVAAVGAIDATFAQGDDDAAFELVFALDEALRAVPAFSSSLGGLLTAGRPGPAVEADMLGHADDLERRGRELADRRAELARLRAVESQARDQALEAERLRQEVEELQRLQRLAGQLERLRAARQTLEQHGTALAIGARDEEEALGAAVQAALEATEHAAEDLRSTVREQRTELADAGAQLSTLRAELATVAEDRRRDESELTRLTDQITAVRAQHKAVRTQLTQLTTDWRAHLATDMEIAEVLLQTVPAGHQSNGRPSGQVVEEISRYVSAHLTQLDQLLRTLLIEAETQYEGKYQKRRLGSAGDPPTIDRPAQ
jgi:hypothetical protein